MTKKTLKDILGEGYLDDMQTPDTVAFVAKHKVDNEPVKKDKKVGTDNDEVFNASNVKAVKRTPRHGHEPEKSKEVYEENDEGYYTHKELFGKDAVSKEDWKKGWRLNSKGERVQLKKANEEVEQINELDRDGIVKRYAEKTRKKVEYGEEPVEKRAAGRLLAGMKRWGGTGGIPAAKVPAVTREEVESDDWHLSQKHLEAGKKAYEALDKGDLKTAKKHLDTMKDLSKQMAEEVELAEKMSDEQKKGIRTALGPKVPGNEMRKGTKSARELIKLVKSVNEDLENLIAEAHQQVDEKTLTPPEMKKRKEIADAIKREHPEYSDEKKMKIATAQAIKVAESSMDSYLNTIKKVDPKRPFDGKGDSASNIQEFKNPGFGGKDEPYSGRNLQPSMNQKNIPDALRVTPEVSKPKPSASAEPKAEPKKPEVAKAASSSGPEPKKPEAAKPEVSDKSTPPSPMPVSGEQGNFVPAKGAIGTPLDKIAAKDTKLTRDDKPITAQNPSPMGAMTKFAGDKAVERLKAAKANDDNKPITAQDPVDADQERMGAMTKFAGDKAVERLKAAKAQTPNSTQKTDSEQSSSSDNADQKKSTNIFKLNRLEPIGKKESTAKELAFYLTPYAQKAAMRRQKELGVEPKGAVIYRNSVSEAVWDNPSPNKKSEKLTPAEKLKAKARAKAAGRPYPNLIDNMAVAKESVEENSMDNEINEALKTPAQRVNHYHTEINKLLKGIASGIHQMKKDSMSHKNYNGDVGPHWGHVGTLSDFHKRLSDLHDQIHQQGEYMKPVSMKEEAEIIDERNKENKFKKDLHVASMGKNSIDKFDLDYDKMADEYEHSREQRRDTMKSRLKTFKRVGRQMTKEESEQNTAAQVASNKHLKAAAQALALAKGVGKNHPDYNTYMAMYASHRKKMMGEEVEAVDEAVLPKFHHEGPKGAVHIKKDSETGEHVVRFWKKTDDGYKRHEPADYFTDDKEDAHSTAKKMVGEQVERVDERMKLDIAAAVAARQTAKKAAKEKDPTKAAELQKKSDEYKKQIRTEEIISLVKAKAKQKAMSDEAMQKKKQ